MQSPTIPFPSSVLTDPEPIASVTEDHVLAAIVGVIQAARQQGQSVEEVQAAVLADDALLEESMRQLLSDVVAEAWHRLS